MSVGFVQSVCTLMAYLLVCLISVLNVTIHVLIQVQKAPSWTGMWLCLEKHCLPLSGSFDWTDRLVHNGLSWRVAAGELCVVFPGLLWYGWA